MHKSLYPASTDDEGDYQARSLVGPMHPYMSVVARLGALAPSHTRARSASDCGVPISRCTAYEDRPAPFGNALDFPRFFLHPWQDCVVQRRAHDRSNFGELLFANHPAVAEHQDNQSLRCEEGPSYSLISWDSSSPSNHQHVAHSGSGPGAPE